jgi:hypothetical protein
MVAGYALINQNAVADFHGASPRRETRALLGRRVFPKKDAL